MTSRRKFVSLALTVLAGCEANVDGWTKDDPGGAPDDVQEALRQLPNAEVLEWTADDHLRHSKFVALRDDKRAKDVRRE